MVPNMFGSNVSPVRPPSSGAGAPPSPSKGKATTAGWLRYVVPLADFALIRRFAPPSPPGGRLLPAVRIFSVLLLNLPDESAMSLTMRDCRSSLPPGGEGGAPAPDEGEIGERTHVMHPSPSLPPGGEGGAPATDEGEIGERTAKRIAPQKRFRLSQKSSVSPAPRSSTEKTARKAWGFGGGFM